MCLSLLLLRSSPSFSPHLSKENGPRKTSILPYNSFVFPNSDAERTPVGARYRRGRVLRVRIVLYSGSVEGLCERDIRNLARKLFANIASLPSNFQTAALKERLSMLAVAIAVSSVSSLLFSLSCRLEEGRESLQTRDTRGKTEDLQLH